MRLLRTLTPALVTLATAIGLAAVPAHAASLDSQDKTFLTDNAQTNLAEIALAELALQRTQTIAVRNLATTLLLDHQKAQAKLTKVAQSVGFTLPSTPNQAQLTQANELKKVGALDFDKAWLGGEASGHELSIKNTQLEIRKGSDPAVIDYAKAYLPIVKTHLGLVNQTIQATHLDIPLATAPPPLSTPNSAVVTTGPLANGAKTSASSDTGWLIGLLVLLLVGAAGLVLRVARSSAAGKH